MKILETYFEEVLVGYFGHGIVVPNWTKWMATNRNGYVYVWDDENKPWKCADGWDSDGKNECVAKVELEDKEWYETLVDLDAYVEHN